MVNFVRIGLLIPELTLRLAGFLSISVLESIRTLVTCPKSLNGEIALVTGGGSGIGRGIALEVSYSLSPHLISSVVSKVRMYCGGVGYEHHWC